MKVYMETLAIGFTSPNISKIPYRNKTLVFASRRYFLWKRGRSCEWLYVLVMSRTRFQSESTLYSCLNVKELLARSRREIWRWSDCNWTRTQNHLVLKRTLNHLAKWLSVRLRTKWFWVRVQLQSLRSCEYFEIIQNRCFIECLLWLLVK